MSDELEVRVAAGLVGTLRRDAEGRMQFAYARSWLDAGPLRFALSLTLPLREEPFHEPAHAFFANLLPEAEVRRTLCERLGLSADNDFGLLEAIGADCAGALMLTPPGTRALEKTGYREIKAEKLAELAASHQVLAALDGTAGVRLSLAGAQDKLPVLIDGERIFLPLGGAASTHLLKLPSARFKHLPANETFMSLLARAIDLPAVAVELWPLRKEGMCVIERYDRVRTGPREVRRVHQEDLCQALGRPPHLKYEREGGPGFAECFERVRSASAEPLVDGRTLLRWHAFNVMAFNADGHAKNLSLLHGDSGIRLAPLYDLVCTRAWPRLSRDFAMSTAGEFDATLVLGNHWTALARKLGLGSSFVLELVRELGESFPDALSAATKEFKARYGDRAALQLIVPKVRKQARRIVQQLSAPSRG